MNIVVMGVSGSGKSTVGVALAAAIGARFVDGDDLHPAANVAKMSTGVALDDDDRWPWLARVSAVLAGPEPVVVACSALARRYRDLLRRSLDVVFVHLHLERDVVVARLAARSGHFMDPGLADSQFAALETPGPDESDVAVIDADRAPDEVLAAVVDAVSGSDALAPGPPGEPLHRFDAEASLDTVAAAVVDHVLATRPEARRVLLVPPDHTRSHSGAGAITVAAVEGFSAAGREVAVFPALGTHVPMRDADAKLLFGPDAADRGCGADDLLVHEWRSGLRPVGRIEADEVAVATDGRYAEPIDVAVDAQLFDADVVVSIGQVVPHEVIGMANFTKNLVIGLGGADVIRRSHFVGAIAGMEAVMGETTGPVRHLVDAAFDRFLAPELDVIWVLTVVDDTGRHRGAFVGEGGSMASGGAAFRQAADLARVANVTTVDRPLGRVSCWLDADEFHSTWLGNKAIYRTRMALADGAELIVLAPGVQRFGEDPDIDRLIRRHGYRGTPATLAALDDTALGELRLGDDLSAAAHLIHGSSEGRFRVVYCTDPDAGGLRRDEVEGVGFEWRPLADELAVLGVDGDTPSGERVDRDGTAFTHIANPALGLWRADATPAPAAVAVTNDLAQGRQT